MAIFTSGYLEQSATYTELQIWRSSGDGSYTKVRNTTIMTEENTTQLYEYPLSSPLPFQEGDILGYYLLSLSRSQLGLKLELGYGHKLHYKETAFEDDSFTESKVLLHVLVAVETGEPQ